MAEHVIDVKDLAKIYKMGSVEVKALAGVTFTIDQGEILSIMGPSGSGKSTLMNLLGCLDIPSAGALRLKSILPLAGGTNASARPGTTWPLWRWSKTFARAVIPP